MGLVASQVAFLFLMSYTVLLPKDAWIPCNREYGVIKVERLFKYWDEEGFAIPVLPLKADFMPAYRPACEIHQRQVNSLPPAKWKADVVLNCEEVESEAFVFSAPYDEDLISVPLATKGTYLASVANMLHSLPFRYGAFGLFESLGGAVFPTTGEFFLQRPEIALYNQVVISLTKDVNLKKDMFNVGYRIRGRRQPKRNPVFQASLHSPANYLHYYNLHLFNPYLYDEIYATFSPFLGTFIYTGNMKVRRFPDYMPATFGGASVPLPNQNAHWNTIAHTSLSGSFHYLGMEYEIQYFFLRKWFPKPFYKLLLLNLFFPTVMPVYECIYGDPYEKKYFSMLHFRNIQARILGLPPIVPQKRKKLSKKGKFVKIKMKREIDNGGFIPVFVGNTSIWIGGVING